MCGILAFLGDTPDPSSVISALSLIRHRGQDGFGAWMVSDKTSDTNSVQLRQVGKGNPDLAYSLLADQKMTFIAHWRYATRGGRILDNMQPLLVNDGSEAFAHNGQFQFADDGNRAPISDSVRFVKRLTKKPEQPLGQRIYDGLADLRAAYALAAGSKAALVVARDPYGLRPLFWGKYSGGIAVSSEEPALQALNCAEISAVPAGSVISWSRHGHKMQWSLPKAQQATCSFEYIYFHGEAGRLEARSIYWYRYLLGWELAGEAPVKADAIAAVPQSANAFARGYADRLELPLTDVIRKRRGAVRTFIENEADRAKVIRQKYEIIPELAKDKAIAVIDDSLVRGTTFAYLVKELRHAGALHVHGRIGSPRFLHPCFFGIDVPDRSKLISYGVSQTAVGKKLCLDSLAFLSTNGLRNVLGQDICTGCFTGMYPPGLCISRLQPDSTDLRMATA